MASPSSSSTTDKARIYFITLGCAKNEVDTDRMKALLQASGFYETTKLEEASCAIINTCSFLESATEESIEATLELAEAHTRGVGKLPIIMCGCVPSRYGKDVERELPEVSAFVAHDREDGIVSVVKDVLGIETTNYVEDASTVLRTASSACAYIKISEGCDRFCTFCAIPYIRGRYYSRPAQDIISEVKYLAEHGVREFVLIGQDTGIWGSDFAQPQSLASLIRELADLVRPFGGWLRVLYLQPEGMTDELISCFKELDELLPYIDIPIQHCSEKILKRMGRKGDSTSLFDLFTKLRAEIPSMVLRSTAMAGFPGESDEEAQELLDFVSRVGFDYLSVFAYSKEEGTRAAKLDGQIDETLKLERTQRLIDAAERMGFASSASHVGEIVDVIIDGVDTEDGKTELIGHSWFQAPDSDGVIHIEEGEASVGDICKVEIVDSFCYELIGKLVSA